MVEEAQSQIPIQGVKEEKKGNPIAILSYIGILFIIPLLATKDDEFVKFHVKQGITLFIAEIITFFIGIIPILGWIIGLVGWITWLVLSIIGIMNVMSGKQVPLPVIGKFAEKFKF